MAEETVKLETAGLDKILRAMKMKLPTARVGIMGEKNMRAGTGKSGKTNAEIGAIHEYGCPKRNIPIRSFLRVPIADHLEKEMEASGAYDDKTLRDVIREGSFVPWVKKMAIIAEKIVQGGFATGGFGQWAPHKPSYTNNTGQILIDTQQLRNSITSQADE